MDINGIRSTDILTSTHAAAYGPHMQGSSVHPQKDGDEEDLEISEIGSLMNAVSQMSGDDRDDIKSFMDDLRSSVKEGSFNAEDMAVSAPEALTSYAEENDIDLTSLIQDLADVMENAGGVYGPPPPPPPPMMPGMSGLDTSSLEDLSEDEISEIQSFMEGLTASVEDGTFDAGAMADEAPEALKTLAEENGMELTEMLEYMAGEIEDSAGAPPSPPPMMYGSRGMGFEPFGTQGMEFFNRSFSAEGDEETSAAESA